MCAKPPCCKWKTCFLNHLFNSPKPSFPLGWRGPVFTPAALLSAGIPEAIETWMNEPSYSGTGLLIALALKCGDKGLTCREESLKKKYIGLGSGVVSIVIFWVGDLYGISVGDCPWFGEMNVLEMTLCLQIALKLSRKRQNNIGIYVYI